MCIWVNALVVKVDWKLNEFFTVASGFSMVEPGGNQPSRFVCPCLACGSWRRLGELLDRFHSVEGFRVQTAAALRATFDQLWDQACSIAAPIVLAPVAEGAGTLRPTDTSLQQAARPAVAEVKEEPGVESPKQSKPGKKEKRRSRSRRRRKEKAEAVSDSSRGKGREGDEDLRESKDPLEKEGEDTAEERRLLKSQPLAPGSPGEKNSDQKDRAPKRKDKPKDKEEKEAEENITRDRSRPRPSQSQVAVPRRRRELDKPPGKWHLRPRSPSRSPPAHLRGPRQSWKKDQGRWHHWGWPKTSRGRVQRARREDIQRHGPDPERKKRREEEQWNR